MSVHGADQMNAAMHSFWTGVPHATYTELGVRGLAGPKGLDLHPLVVDNLVVIADFAPSLAAGGVLAIGRDTAVKAIRNVAVPARVRVVYSSQQDIGKIWGSQRAWGQTEGSVYGMRVPDAPRWRTMINPRTRDPGTIVFKENAAELFASHKVWGPFSGLKYLFGQQKAGFGDIIFDEAYRSGTRIFVYEAHIGGHAGQSSTLAAARLWSRRAFDIGADIGIAAGVIYILLSE
jgi:hypothetical protein